LSVAPGPRTRTLSNPATQEAPLDNPQFERIPAYPLPDSSAAIADPMAEFKVLTGNPSYRTTMWTWVSLGILLLFYPGISLMADADSMAEMMKNIDQQMLIFVLLTTVVFQWTIFAINYGSIFSEGTGLAGVGLIRIRPVDLAWTAAFLLAAGALLSGLAWLLAQLGLEVPGEVSLLIPQTAFGRVVWVLVSFTAGFCEEVAYRGYLLTRLRMIFGASSWTIPMIISSVAFGICHWYQGVAGLILITIYGFLFAFLFIRTGRLWPCILAHALWDFGNLFFPK
jgi:membrane protease YdiL (CAAX protease family)